MKGYFLEFGLLSVLYIHSIDSVPEGKVYIITILVLGLVKSLSFPGKIYLYVKIILNLTAVKDFQSMVLRKEHASL